MNGALDGAKDKVRAVNQEANRSGSIFSGAFWGTFAANAASSIAQIGL